MYAQRHADMYAVPRAVVRADSCAVTHAEGDAENDAEIAQKRFQPQWGDLFIEIEGQPLSVAPEERPIKKRGIGRSSGAKNAVHNDFANVSAEFRAENVSNAEMNCRNRAVFGTDRLCRKNGSDADEYAEAMQKAR